MKDTRLLIEPPTVPLNEPYGRDMHLLMDGYRKMSVFRAAVDISLFRYTRVPVDTVQLASLTRCDPFLIGMLCEALAEIGLLEISDGMIRNSDYAAEYLDPESPRYQCVKLKGIIQHMDNWSDLSRALREGRRKVDAEVISRESWIRGIGESAIGGGTSAAISWMDDHRLLSDTGTFLDLGGGHGLYTIAIMSSHPGMFGTLFDKPDMCEVATENFAKYGCSANIIAGDFYTDDIGGPYDLVFSSFNRSASDSSMCGKVFDAVRPGGHLLLRRHLPRKHDPLAILEYNLTDSGESHNPRTPTGSWLPTSEEYLDILQDLGMNVLIREDMGDGTETVLLIRTN